MADAAKIETQMEVDHLLPTEETNNNKRETVIAASKQKLVNQEHKV